LRSNNPDISEYRGLATPLSSKADRVIVTAAPQGDLNYTVGRLVAVQAGTFVTALAALVVVGRMVLRRGLRPLADMASTAHDISSTDLTGNSAQLAARVDGEGGGAEVEELRTSFNVMLAHIDFSLAARNAADLFRYAAANEPAEREAHLARMRDEAARMSVLLDDLLLLARLDAEAPLRTESVDLVELAASATDAFGAAHTNHPLTLRPEQESIPLDADPWQLRQVLDNLLTNAAVHTPEGTEVTLVVHAEPEAAVVEVSDNGPGIHPDDQARAFDRFYRADNSRARGVTQHGVRSGGTGLGLPVVQAVVAAHGGTVTLTSVPGNTTFTVRIPR
jgi:two-component system OmpR family sensor kinase